MSIVDFMRLFAVHGSANCVDERYWQIARAPLAQKALLPIGAEYGKFFRALRGKTKKCLVVDCDNTLWGGIVGEDGLAGIELGPAYPGSCFVALQQEILNLHHRGVILAICSKNNEADVLEVLREHPDMLLEEEHFAARQINWDDKVTNLRRIAAELNIGTDSMVLLDDSEFETDFVRRSLPEVAVIALPPQSVRVVPRLAHRARLFRLAVVHGRGPAQERDVRREPAAQGARVGVVVARGVLGEPRDRGGDRRAVGDRRAARRAAHAKDEPVQPDDAALHRARRAARSSRRIERTCSRSRCATASPTPASSASRF